MKLFSVELRVSITEEGPLIDEQEPMAEYPGEGPEAIMKQLPEMAKRMRLALHGDRSKDRLELREKVQIAANDLQELTGLLHRFDDLMQSLAVPK